MLPCGMLTSSRKHHFIWGYNNDSQFILHVPDALKRICSFVYFIKQQELLNLRELSRFHEEHGHSFGRRERNDSTDSIEDSIETKRLCSEIAKLQAECEHWKSVANGLVSSKMNMVLSCMSRTCKILTTLVLLSKLCQITMSLKFFLYLLCSSCLKY